MFEIKAKCELFNSYFSGQPFPLSIIASSQQDLSSYDSVLTSINFSVKQVTNIIKKLDPN